MMCGFKPIGSGAEEKYNGIIHESGQGLPRGKVVLMWAVLAPTDAKARAGMLAQRYVKTANAPGTPPTLWAKRILASFWSFRRMIALRPTTALP
jgi:hypothetical protein